MKTIRNLVIAGSLVLLLTQCATQDEVRDITYQLRALNQKVEDVKGNTVNQMQKRQASSVNKIDQIERDLLHLKSMLEESAHQSSLNREQGREDVATVQSVIETMRAENKAALDESRQKVQELEQRVAMLSADLERMRQLKIREAERAAREAARKAETARKKTLAATRGFVHVTPEKRKVQTGSARVVDGHSDSSEIALSPLQQEKTQGVSATVDTVIAEDVTTVPLANAMKQFNNGQYQEAYRSYEKVLLENPQGNQAAKTLFYMGESLFRQGEYDLAILDYQKVISNHARSAFAPKALYQQAVSFEKLTDHETAKIIYRKLISDYSASSEAGEAKTRLENL
ncbi:MAG: hypothetical protein CSA32_00610 [Desulfobulbus propionicus]|nr:MAG: hypothetical protein CSA32_00610 [Desulfobulbus propionicus]